ncbi:hypothetical protein ACQ4PT_069769 [Festuca glaucescens]
MEEADELVLVPDAADLRSYQLDEDADDAHDHEAHFLAGNSQKTIDLNYFASEPAISNPAAQCDTMEATVECGTTEAAAQFGTTDATALSGAESDGSGAQSGAEAENESSVDDDVETVDGGLSDEEGLGTEEVEVADEPGCKDREGDHGWQQHAVGVICSVGLAAAATGLALLLGGQQQTPHRVHFRVAGDRKEAKVSARRDARLDQGISVPRFEHAPAIVSFGGSYDSFRF